MASSSRQEVPPENPPKEQTIRPQEEEEKEQESADGTSEESSTRSSEESKEEVQSSEKAAPEEGEEGEEEVKELEADEDEGRGTQPVRPDEREEEVKEPEADEGEGKGKQPLTYSAPPSHSSKSHPPGPADSTKKALFQRLWSKEDEITLLKGIIKYKERYDVDPISDMDDFFQFITRRIDLEVDRRQVLNKMRNCRTKFLNLEASARSGKGRAITDPNEKLVRDLSRRVWGSEDVVIGETSVPKPKNKTGEKTTAAMVVRAEEVENRSQSLCLDMLSRFSNGCMDERFVKRGLEMMSPKRREALEKECWEMNMAELRALSKRARMVQEVTDRVIRSHEKSAR